MIGLLNNLLMIQMNNLFILMKLEYNTKEIKIDKQEINN